MQVKLQVTIQKSLNVNSCWLLTRETKNMLFENAVAEIFKFLLVLLLLKVYGWGMHLSGNRKPNLFLTKYFARLFAIFKFNFA